MELDFGFFGFSKLVSGLPRVRQFKSALFKHEQQTVHNIHYDEVEILDSTDSDKKLLLTEMQLINLHKPSLKFQVKSDFT